MQLETDVNLLPSKAKGALTNYGHQLVIGNLLADHKDRVIFYTKTGSEKVIEKSTEEKKLETDLEEKIIKEIVKMHLEL